MTILVTVLLATSVWVFLAAVLGGCGGKDRGAARDAGNVLAGEFWLWERRDGSVRLQAEAGGAPRAEAPGRTARHFHRPRRDAAGRDAGTIGMGRRPGGEYVKSMIWAALILPLAVGPALAADDSKVRAATRQVETGAKKLGEGKIGEGVEQTAKGIGNTVVEGAKFTGTKVKESGRAAEPKARSAWESTKDGARAFGQSVKTFLTRLFSD